MNIRDTKLRNNVKNQLEGTVHIQQTEVLKTPVYNKEMYVFYRFKEGI